MMNLPPIPYTPPMYRNRPADKRALVWYRPQTPDFAVQWRKLFSEAQAALQNADPDSDAIAHKLDTDTRGMFAAAVECVEIGGVAHTVGSVDLPPQFIAQVVHGIAAGGYDDTYPKP
jgi:hypothetical protein